MKKTIAILVVLAAAGGGGYWYYAYGKKPPEPVVTTVNVTRGSIVDSVSSTGQLSAVRQVPVGSQVPGKIIALHADYNSIVKKDQLLAEIDPLTIETQILQAKANLTRAETDVERARVQLADAQKKFERSKELSSKGIENRAAFDQAELNLASAQSSLKSSEASLQQSQASLKQQELNLTYTKIYAPIDGLVVSRAVDVGQTVSVSQSAPTIFNLVTDLTTMKVLAGVDETDVGRIRPKQRVTFRVDAYPNEVFGGTVEEVRLDSRMQQNVVTYQTLISVPNPELKLRPGMTANVNIEIERRDDVLRVPSAALRFRPTNDMYVALGLTPPAPAERGRGGPGGRQGAPATAGSPAPAGSPAAGSPAARGGQQAPGSTASAGNGENGASGGDRTARTQTRTPEELERMMAQGGTRGGRGGDAADARGGTRGGRGGDAAGRGGTRGSGRGGDGAAGRGGNRGRGGDGRGRGGATGGRGGAPQSAAGQGQGGRGVLTATELAALRDVTSIDLLFPPLPPPESPGSVWTWDKDKKELKSMRLRLGASDGQNQELLEGDLTEGMALVSNVIIPQEVRPAPGTQNNPFFQNQRGGPGGRGPQGPQPNRGGGGGGFDGGGGNRGGGGGGGGGGRGGF